MFTPRAIEVIRDFADNGKSASEIAYAIGSTAASVRVKCCLLRIKVQRRPRGGTARGRETQKVTQKLVVYLRASVYAALEQQANSMKKSAAELAELLLQAIVSSNIYDAVLDEDD